MASDSDLDDRVREALEAEPGTIERMVTTALGRGHPARSPRAGALRFALAGAAVLAGALFFGWPRGPMPGDTDALMVTRAGNLVLIENATGDIWILGPKTEPDPARAGTGFVIVEGDPQ